MLCAFHMKHGLNIRADGALDFLSLGTGADTALTKDWPTILLSMIIFWNLYISQVYIILLL